MTHKDAFLRNHFIIYHHFDKEKDFPYYDIFKEIYTVNRATSNPPLLEHKDIKKYITSIQECVVKWYIINNPEHAFNHKFLENKDEVLWLQRINRLQFRIFGPLLLAAYSNPRYTDEERIELLTAIEAFIFGNYVASGRKRSMGNPHFVNIATKLFQRDKQWPLQAVIDEINRWTYGDETEYGYFNGENFFENIKENFNRDSRNGWYDWRGLPYFLFEYELSLQGKEAPKVDWSMRHSIEHVYPQSLTTNGWKEKFSEWSLREKKVFCNSLGNMLLLSMPKSTPPEKVGFVILWVTVCTYYTLLNSTNTMLGLQAIQSKKEYASTIRTIKASQEVVEIGNLNIASALTPKALLCCARKK